MVLVMVFSVLAFARNIELKIDLHSGNPNEKKAANLIEGFVEKHDLSPYVFTPLIRIQSMVIPHSHPVLTLNTRQISDPDRYLGLFLHEQIHWFFAANERGPQLKNFILRMKSKYPKVPSHKDGGGFDEESTYLHFGVCYYELKALTKYLGEKRAKEIFETEDVYAWIRKEVLANSEFLDKALVDSGLRWKDANK